MKDEPIQSGGLITDLLDQVVQVPDETNKTSGWTFGRVRAAYIDPKAGWLRVSVMLTTGYLIDCPAHNLRTEGLPTDPVPGLNKELLEALKDCRRIVEHFSLGGGFMSDHLSRRVRKIDDAILKCELS